MTHTSLLSLHMVTKDYQQGGKVLPVLRGISAQFQQGESYALTGVSGSGKSTLLHVLGGLDSPTTGTVFFNNKNLAHIKPKEMSVFLNTHIGFVFQFHYLIKELTVLENIMMMGMIKGLALQECKLRAGALLEMVGLSEKADEYPTKLSGGQQQRVAIARALFNKPQFLLADEPTGNLDTQNAMQITDLLFAAQKEWGMGIIICSHDAAIFNRMEHIYRLHDGLLS